MSGVVCQSLNLDDFVKGPISALRFISLSLRRTMSTPHSAGFARLDLVLFTKSSEPMTFYGISHLAIDANNGER
jgi:hypothetical protein